MQTKIHRIIIIGAGFAGSSLARRLAASDLKFDILLVDKKKAFDFLPLLPDIIGRGLNPDYLSFNIEKICRQTKCRFLNAECLGISLDKKEIQLSSEILTYDYLVIASGSETNFYGNAVIKNYAYSVDNVEDIKKITQTLKQGTYDNYIVCGGGYTGIEVATNLKLFLKMNKLNKRVIIVERASKILNMLPDWMQNYVKLNLDKLGIEVIANTVVEKSQESSVYLSDKRTFANAFLVWVAGVKTAPYIQNLQVEKNAQGRIKVDGYLRLNDFCFVVGDAAFFSNKNEFLRMAIQFAIAQGDQAAKNIIRSIKNMPLKKYRALDLGYIIPMANNRSCGRVLGVNVLGSLATFLHFTMCIFRSVGWKNRWGLIYNLLRGGEKC